MRRDYCNAMRTVELYVSYQVASPSRPCRDAISYGIESEAVNANAVWGGRQRAGGSRAFDVCHFGSGVAVPAIVNKWQTDF